MPGAEMIIDDSAQKTSIKMTRSMAEDTGLRVKKILEQIIDGSIDLPYSEWIWLVSQTWCDDIWISAMIKVVIRAKYEGLNLNKNQYFLDLILERTPSEMKAEFKKIHSIARLSLMELLNKKTPEPEPKHQAKGIWD